MRQTDWLELIRGALWILGLGIALAGWSYASWWGKVHGLPLRKVVGLPMFTVPFFAGLALFSAGLAWGLDRLWLRVLWTVIGLWCLWETARGWRTAASRKQMIHEESDETH